MRARVQQTRAVRVRLIAARYDEIGGGYGVVRRADPRLAAAPAVCASAEALPFADGAFDAAMAVLTVQHWADVERGIAELRRVARRRVVLVTMDTRVLDDLWLIRHYVPELREAHRGFPAIERLRGCLPGAKVAPLPVSRDCTDGFLAAFWGRPEAYLDPGLRAGTSPWSVVPATLVDAGLARLRDDLANGTLTGGTARYAANARSTWGFA